MKIIAEIKIHVKLTCNNTKKLLFFYILERKQGKKMRVLIEVTDRIENT